MPKVTFTNTKGLVQSAGSGFDLTGMGTGNGPNIKKPVVSLTAATKTVTTAESGTVFTFNKADGVVVTLPAAAVGLVYEFYVETALTSNAYTVNAASDADTLTGMLMSWDIADVGTHTDLNDDDGVSSPGWSNPAAADHQLVTNKTTTGGLKGSFYRYRCMSDALWHVEGVNFCSSGANNATPFT